MFDTTHGTDCLKLYLDRSNTVWYCDEDGNTSASQKEPLVFVTEDLRNVDTVRLMGLHSNAELICWLYQNSETHGYPSRVQIGTPAFCTRRDFTDPARLMFQMQEISGLTVGAGGWHNATAHDFITYLLICAFREEKFDELDDILALHPAWPAISFIPTGDLFEATRLLVEIGDPRWFVDPDNPERYSRLRAYLGLTERNVCYLRYNNPVTPILPDFNCQRCEFVLDAWLRNKAMSDDIHEPRDFLRRRLYRLGNTPRAVLRTSNFYINFVRLIWLDAVSLAGHDEYFVPDYFFDWEEPNYRNSLIHAYKEHSKKLRVP